VEGGPRDSGLLKENIICAEGERMNMAGTTGQERVVGRAISLSLAKGRRRKREKKEDSEGREERTQDEDRNIEDTPARLGKPSSFRIMRKKDSKREGMEQHKSNWRSWRQLMFG